MKLIKFPVGTNGWNPKELKHVLIKNIHPLSSKTMVGKTGFEFRMFIGEISDEDATYLKMSGSKIRFAEMYDIPKRYQKWSIKVTP